MQQKGKGNGEEQINSQQKKKPKLSGDYKNTTASKEQPKLDTQQRMHQKIQDIKVLEKASIQCDKNYYGEGNKLCYHVVQIPIEQQKQDQQKLDEHMYGTINKPKYNGEYAKKYPFQLDPFQNLSVACLERRENLFVAAHTSAGKTAVAEYAVAMSFRDKQRVVYTSPLKALSNQKYRELSEEFEDVGLMTGDISLNPNANCLIMTTEILRSMLYRGSELLKEIAWVIFDEVHYMQDRDRGVVWEETIVLMSKQVNMIFLSATLPNAEEFAAWISYVHKNPCHVVYTEYRPVALCHFAYPLEGSGLYKLVDANTGEFIQGSFDKMKEQIQNRGNQQQAGKQVDGPARQNGQKEDQDVVQSGNVTHTTISQEVHKIIVLIQKKKLWPVIFFSFSRRSCEVYAKYLQKRGVDFTNDEEKEAIEQIYNNALESLSEQDRDLEAVTSFLQFLKCGIAVHHSGLLPILKEVTEILFQEQLVKCLFATETFAMGLNMPAKTTIFTKLQKWDGETIRYMGSNEYIQMSGRAGRRGTDVMGFSIMMVDKEFEEEAIKGMIKGKAAPLVSNFKLSYYTLLNLLKRREGNQQTMEHVIQNSFSQFQYERELPQTIQELDEVKAQLKSYNEVNNNDIFSYQSCVKKLEKLKRSFIETVFSSGLFAQVLCAGRVVRIQNQTQDWKLGVVISVIRKANNKSHQINAANQSNPRNKAQSQAQGEETIVVDCLVCVKGDAEEGEDQTDNTSTTIQNNGSAQQHRVAGAQGNQWSQSKGNANAYTHTGQGMVNGGNYNGTQNGKLVNGMGKQEISPGDVMNDRDEMHVIPLDPQQIKEITKFKVPLPKDLRPNYMRQQVQKRLKEIYKETQNCTQLMHYADLETDRWANEGLKQTLRQIDDLQQKLGQNQMFNTQNADEKKYSEYQEKAELLKRQEDLKKKIKNSQITSYEEEAKQRSDVLRKMGYIDNEGVITIKGRASCEIDTADELLTTEMMFNGTFNSLDIHKLVALVSCLVTVEKSEETIQLTTQLSEAIKSLQDTAKYIAGISKECKLEVDEEAYIESFKPYLMDVIYAWSKGASFQEICNMTDIYEGSIIRAARRLDELMQQLERASGVIGYQELSEKFKKSAETIRRDIMFAPSLYI